MLRITLIALILLPLAEIFLFVQVGSVIGAGGVIAAIIATGMGGLLILRRQGIAQLRAIQACLQQGETPLIGVFEGMLLALAGILLFFPGFLTDAIGVCLLPPPMRRGVIRLFSAWAARRARESGNGRTGAPTIETDYHHIQGETRD